MKTSNQLALVKLFKIDRSVKICLKLFKMMADLLIFRLFCLFPKLYKMHNRSAQCNLHLIRETKSQHSHGLAAMSCLDCEKQKNYKVYFVWSIEKCTFFVYKMA